jgi:hypothetical protein
MSVWRLAEHVFACPKYDHRSFHEVEQIPDDRWAADALLQWAFATMDLNRVHAEADTRNVASGRVLE